MKKTPDIIHEDDSRVKITKPNKPTAKYQIGDRVVGLKSNGQFITGTLDMIEPDCEHGLYYRVRLKTLNERSQPIYNWVGTIEKITEQKFHGDDYKEQ